MQEIMVAEKLDDMEKDELIEVFARLRAEEPEALEAIMEILDDII